MLIFHGFARILICVVAIAGLLHPTVATAVDAKSAFSPAQREELHRDIREYIMANPEIIKDAAIALQAKEEAARETERNAALISRRQELLYPAEGTVMGNPRGDVTVVEFFDYNCGYCKRMFTQLMDLIADDGKVRLVLKEFPILAPSSVTAAQAALAAAGQNKYKEMHIALITYKGSLSDQVVLDLAKNVGLDISKLKADMKSPDIANTLAHNQSLAKDLHVSGTPAIIVGNDFISGVVSKENLARLIAKKRSDS